MGRNYSEKVCAECGVTFVPTGPGQKYCDDHRKNAWQRANRSQTREIARKANRKMRDGRKWGDARVYDRLVAVFGDICGICGASPPKPRAHAIDHDHTTGAIRGLLCVGHNAGLGYFADDPELLIAAADYLLIDRSDLAARLDAVVLDQEVSWDRSIAERWSRRYDACVNPDCATPDSPHYARGYCDDCYRPMIRAERAARGYQRTDRPVRSDEEKRAARSAAAREAAARRTEEERAAASAALSAARVGNRRVYDDDGSWHYEKVDDGPFRCAECGATDRPHRSLGLCSRCYDRSRRKQVAAPEQA